MNPLRAGYEETMAMLVGTGAAFPESLVPISNYVESLLAGEKPVKKVKKAKKAKK
jgi:hypothetical protein